MTKTSKYLLSFLSIAALAILVFWGTNRWLENKLRAILEQNIQDGTIKYGTLSVDLFSNRGEIDSISWSSIQNKDTAVSLSCEKLVIEDFSLSSWIFQNQIILQKVRLIRPDVVFRKNKEDTTHQQTQNSRRTLPSNLKIIELEIAKGSITGYDTSHYSTKFYGEIENLSIKNIRSAPERNSSSIPFLLDAYSLHMDTLYYNLNDLRYVTISQINIRDKDITVDSLFLKSKYDVQEFHKHIPYEKNWVDLFISRMKVNNFLWKDQDSILLKSSFIHLLKPSLHLAKDKTLPVYPYEKPLYSKMIRELPFAVNIDSIKVSGGTIVYDHYTRSTYSPGKVYIDELNGSIQNLTNVGTTGPNFKQTHVTASAVLMRDSRAVIDWKFYINDPRDQFTISGNLSKITHKGINYFVRPALDMEAEGSIDDVAFNFAGNAENAKGDFRIRYDDFHLYFLKEEGRKKQFFKSAFANLFINNTMKKPVEKKGVTVERPKSKSFWAYLWGMIQKGMRETII